MDPLRKAISRYAVWLEGRAQRYEVFARVLTAVAHRLRSILEDTEPDTETQYGAEINGAVVLLDTFEGLPPGTRLYTRTATYTPWKEIR